MNSIKLLAVMAITTVLGAALTPAAEARTRQTTVTGAQGKSASRQVTRDHGDVSSSTTGPNGKSTSRVVDRSPGQTTATVTGPNGQSATRTTKRSRTSTATTSTPSVNQP
jgi:hypothetical protein